MGNGKSCKLCGSGGCKDSLEFSVEEIKIICYVCEKCKTQDYEGRVKSRLLDEMCQRRWEGKAPDGLGGIK